MALDLNPGKQPDGSSTWSLWNNTEGGRGPSAQGLWLAEDHPRRGYGWNRTSQGLWLEQDLAAAHANRGNVPWIIVTSHFPLQHTSSQQSGQCAAREGRRD